MSSKPAFDVDVKNYTTEQLMEMVELSPDDLTNPAVIINQTSNFMAKYPKVANFGQEIQNIMLQISADLAAGGDAATPAAAQQQRNWYENEAPAQDDEAQREKITARKQKIDVFGNQHVPMNRQHLGVNNSYVLPVAQDVLNPNLRTSTQRIVNLDSQFREPSNGESATNYTCNLRDTIYRAYSLRLYSFQIPYTWYVIDTAYGNTCFWIVAEEGYYISVSVAPGNYADAAFAGVLNTALTAAGFTFGVGVTPVTYSANTGKLTFTLYGGTFNGTDIYGDPAAFTIDETTQMLFFDFAGKITCGASCTQKGHYLNSTLGWIMGFRTPYVAVLADGNIPPAVMDLNGPKYLLLAIDDYCQNHVNHGLVSIDQPNRHFKLPGYYTPNMPYTCLPAGAPGTALSTLVEEVEEDGIVTDTEGMLIGAKYATEYTPTQIVLPSAPRVLTQSQIYTINEINKINNNNVSYLAPSPSSPDILSLLPVKVNGLGVSDMIIEFSGSLQDNIRNYFGPVNIKRLGVRLLDDKGHVLNLNGADWNVTLIFDCLYQY